LIILVTTASRLALGCIQLPSHIDV